MKTLKGMFGSLIAAGAIVAMSSAQAAEIRYDTWYTNEGVSGNYILEVDDTGDRFNFNLTVDPWNAEAFGLFVDFGPAVATGAADLQGDSAVSLTGMNVTGSSCGTGGCNVNGMDNMLPDSFDGTWGLVFQLGKQGFEGLQSFSWSTGNFGLGLADFGVVAVRGQNLCSGDDTLDNGDQGCGGSDKSFGLATPASVPEPGMLGLMGLGLLMLAFRRRSKAA